MFGVSLLQVICSYLSYLYYPTPHPTSTHNALAMAGVFDIDLDQPDENVSDDELEDGVSLREHLG
uniref:Uncharacterized protein n=1 Tax=Mola mola TaxID=94237 RepID=A0A3Q4ASA6_MOLML